MSNECMKRAPNLESHIITHLANRICDNGLNEEFCMSFYHVLALGDRKGLYSVGSLGVLYIKFCRQSTDIIEYNFSVGIINFNILI